VDSNPCIRFASSGDGAVFVAVEIIESGFQICVAAGIPQRIPISWQPIPAVNQAKQCRQQPYVLAHAIELPKVPVTFLLNLAFGESDVKRLCANCFPTPKHCVDNQRLIADNSSKGVSDGLNFCQ